MKKEFVGLNIQHPWSSLLLEGEKTIETRSYPIPEKYIGETFALIETPGKNNKVFSKARIVGLITFSGCKQYKSKKEWKNDVTLHLVKDGDIYGWKNDKEKWGWIVEKIVKFNKHVPPPKKRGIVYTKSCLIPSSLI